MSQSRLVLRYIRRVTRATRSALTSSRAMRPQILAMGLADEAELDEIDQAARGHFADPNTLVMSGLLFLAWGRKPAP